MFALDDLSARHFRDEVRRAGELPQARIAIECIYEALQDAIDLQRPRCDASGRCCNFEAFGHRLFITTLEMAVFARQVDRSIAVNQSAINRSGAGCPFQLAKLCGVHSIRPFGCRIFFCDPAASEWQSMQYERMHREIKKLHERFDVRYFYVEWREALRAVGDGVRGEG